MTEGRKLAVVSDYSGLMGALKARADELKKHPVKFLGPVPIRMLGRTSLGPMLTAMGLAIVVIEDPAALERIKPHLTQRRRSISKNASDVLATGDQQKLAFLKDTAWAEKMNRRRSKKLDSAQRQAIARFAAAARWARKRRRGQESEPVAQASSA